MTDDTAARLRALAERAPKGPWTLLGAPDDAEPHIWTIVTVDGLWTAREPVAEFHKLRPEARALQAAAGRYIAAVSPDAILALLDALDEARRERDEAVASDRESIAMYHRCRDRRDAAVALIAAHNAECERLCHRDIKGGRCEAYVSRGRECTDCPRDWMIDARALLGGGEG